MRWSPSARRRSRGVLSELVRHLDLILRFVFVALIPPILAVVNAVIPVGAIVISAAIAISVASFGAGVAAVLVVPPAT